MVSVVLQCTSKVPFSASPLIIVDDLFLDTDIWNVTSGPDPEGQRSRINTTDIQMHITWQAEFVKTLNPGSVYFIEVGFNGNGNMDFVGNLNTTVAENCPDSEDVDDPISPSQNAEWIKPLGTGVNMWPANAQYVWSKACILLDPLAEFFQTAANRDAIAWITHTFTHEDLENSTYYDTNLEISFNYKHAVLLGISNAKMWSNSSLIPPSISGMHNGDALQAFVDNGIRAGVGDSTRPALLNPNNTHWPLITTVAENGFAGFTIIPRWATRVYYNVYVVESVDLTSGEINTRAQTNGELCLHLRRLLALAIFTLFYSMKSKCRLPTSLASPEVCGIPVYHLMSSSFHVSPSQSSSCRCLDDNNQWSYQTAFTVPDVGGNNWRQVR